MRFERMTYPNLLPEMEAYVARRGPWNFLVIKDGGQWTASYRLKDDAIRQGQTVSASSTIMGPFDDFADAVSAAKAKWAELRRLA